MAEVNETKKPVKNRKKTVWLIVAGAVLAVMLLAALALFCPGVSLLRTPAPAAVTPPPVPEATAEPTPEATAAPVYAAGYMRSENGLFRGADTLTAGEAADAVQRAAGITLAVDDASLPLTEVSLAALLDGAFPTDAIENAMTAIAMHGGETVTRAEAAVFFDRLFSLPAADTETAFYPDVIPGEWASGDIYTAADGAAVWDGPEGRPAEGPVLIDSQLYYAGADGYFLKNAYSGSLFFDSAGRYTSGNAELDGYVLAALREAGIEPGIAHILNSSGVLHFSGAAMDAVRVGSALLGRVHGGHGLKRVGYCETQVEELKWLPKGHTTGYGAGWKAKRPTRVAILPVGWYNGFGCEMGNDLFRFRDCLRRIAASLRVMLFGKAYYVTINGKRCKVLGHIGMLHTAADVSGIQCSLGDPARVEINPLMQKGMDVEWR